MAEISARAVIPRVITTLICTNNMHGVKPITAEHLPGAKTCWTAQSETCAILKDFRISAKLTVDLPRTSSGTEKSSNLSPIQTDVSRQQKRS